MYTKEFLETLKQQEATLQYNAFNYEDAYRLGTKLREEGLKDVQPVAVRVVVEGLIVYQSFPEGTTSENGAWMDRKYATVMHTHTSSLRAAVERELFGCTEAWQQDEKAHAFCGGAFPIKVNGAFVGVAIVSGLPHLEDHDLLVRVLKEDLA